jgi:hypothetical protein
VKWNEDENSDVYEPSISFVRIWRTSMTSPSVPRPFSTALRTAIEERAVREKIRH